MHLGVEEATGEIVAVVTSQADVADGTAFADVLAPVEEPIRQCSCEGALTTGGRSGRPLPRARGAIATIPPRTGAVIRQHGNCHAPPLARDEALGFVRRHGLRRGKAQSGYSRRSLAQTAMMRQKVILGAGLSSGSLARQAVECPVRCALLNGFSVLGMPESYAVSPPAVSLPAVA